GDRPAPGAGLERRRPSRGARLRGGDRGLRGPGPPLPHLLMARFLHLLKRDSPIMAGAVVEGNRRGAGAAGTVGVLHDAPPPPAQVTIRRLGADLDYPALLELIFASDHVVSW